MDKGLMWWTRV